jgi:sensor c-di-GMP phosphodiesterase-like protein
MMMRTAQQRMRFTLIVAILAAFMGMAGGFLLFRFVALRQAMIELDRHALRYMLRAEESSKTSERFLTSMAAAGLPACSDAEIALMHHLLFQSEFLKDGGRMSDGKVQCSATFRASELSQTVFKPAFRLKDGTEVYTDLRMVPGDPEPRVGVQRGGFFVSYLHWRPDRLGDLPLNFTLTEVDDTGRQPGWLHGETPQAAVAILGKNGWARVGQTLYATHCSPHYFNCFTAFVDAPKVLAARSGQSAACTALGGLAGAGFGLAFSLIYRRNRRLVQQLRKAIHDDRLRVVYQPIVQLDSRRIVAAEALARWTDDDGFAVNPELFVRMSEENGFATELTELVVRHALREFGDTLRAQPDFGLSINVTATDLSDPAFLPMLDRSLAAARVAARNFAIEITESSTARKETAVEAIRQLRLRGHSVHIDDFGTGYSSLSYLHSLSIDAIKIDKSFTRAIGTEAVTVSILPQILAMADTLKLQVIVEGIETEEQAGYFAANAGSIRAQGWLFGHPVPASDFRRILAEDTEKALNADGQA